MLSANENINYTVVISYCCQRIKELKQLIKSIKNQSLGPSQILVITDGYSPELSDLNDEIVEVIENPKSKRPGPLRNRGIKEANNRFIFICDDDDVWHANKAEIQLNQIILNGADLCFSKSITFVNGKTPKPAVIGNSKSDVITFNSLLFRNTLPMSSCLVDSEKLNLLFDESIYVRGWADYACWLRLSRQIKIIQVNSDLLYYRIHKGSMRSGVIFDMLAKQQSYILNNLNLNLSQKILVRIVYFFRGLKWKLISETIK
jgi:glycosyltransferase involved in cell wall biosynthesis